MQLSYNKIYILGGMSLVLGILFNFLFFDKALGVSFVIYAALLLFGLFGFFKVFKIKYDREALWFIAPIIFFSGMVFVRDSKFLLFWNLLLTFCLFVLLAGHLAKKSVKKYVLYEYLKTFVLSVLGMFLASFRVLGRMLSVRNKLKGSQKTSQIIKGLIITLPLLLIFTILLSSADLAFGKFLSDVFSFNISLRVKAQIFLALFFTFIWLGAYAYIFEHASKEEAEEQSKSYENYKLGNIETGILFGALNLLFAAFVVIQIRYLFAGQGAIVNLGFTYAQYAHKGFAELSVVGLMVFGVIFGADKYIEKTENGQYPVFVWLSGILILLTIIIMGSAFMRLSIYEQAYSFTLMRLLVQAFIIWLGLVFLWLFYKIISCMPENRFVFGIFLSVLLFFAVVNLMNPDKYIARKNIEQFVKEDRLDTYYLSALSADASGEIFALTQLSGYKDKYGQKLSFVAAGYLKNMQHEYSLDVYGHWQSFNFSRVKALQLVNKNQRLINELANKEN